MALVCNIIVNEGIVSGVLPVLNAVIVIVVRTLFIYTHAQKHIPAFIGFLGMRINGIFSHN
jgi:hypothetical protein